MRILLTGATGFVGKAFVNSLVSNDELVYLGRSKLDYDRELTTFIETDLTNTRSINEAAKRLHGDFDAVVHLAAYVPKNPYEDKLSEAYNVNVLGTINLLEAFHRRFQRLIIGSTAEVYDQARIKQIIDEDTPVNAGSYYGSTKLAGELIARTYGSKNKISTIILRFSVMYGANDPITRALPNFIKAALKDEAISVTGGGILRDYIHIDDVVKSIHDAIKSESSGVANIGTGRGVSIESAARAIIEISKSRSELIIKPATSGVDIIIDPQTAKDLIGFDASIFFPDKIDDMIESYR